MSRPAFKFIFREIARRNRMRNGLIYLQVTRGAFRRDHPIPAESAKPTVIITAKELDPTAVDARKSKGIKVITRPDERWARCDIKTTQLLPNLLAKTDARKDGAYEAWLVDRDGFVTEGSSTTAWIVTANGEIVTRDLSNAILPGVTRHVITTLAKRARIPIVERRMTVRELLAADEVLLTASTIEVLPVVRVEKTRIGNGRPGPVTRLLQDHYHRHVARTVGRR
jgi:D-alanine transaminase